MKINGLQMFWLIFTMQIGMLLIRITQTLETSKQDAWISIIITGILGIGAMYVVMKVSLLYPAQTLVEFTQTILGKWIGITFLIPYFAFWYTTTPILLIRSSDLIHLAFFSRTPMYVLIIGQLLVSIYVTYAGGITAIARCCELMGPIIILMVIVVFCLGVNNLDWHQLLPVYADSGVTAIMKGSLPPLSLLSESNMLMMFVAFMTVRKHAVSSVMWAIGISTLFLLIATMFILMTFGPALSSDMSYPFYDLVRFVSISEFIQNVDVLALVIWIFSVFIKNSLYLFITSYGTAQLFGVKDWRKMIWVVSAIFILLIIIYPDNPTIGITYNKKLMIPYITPLESLIIPLILWIVGTHRKKSAMKNS